MDLRVEKTKRNIINAFLQLRSKLPVEKITVKELSSLAKINKATFYLHYHDIYDLSESLELDTVLSVLNSIEHPEFIFNDNRKFVRELTISFASNEQMIKTLFEGTRSSSFMTIFERELMKLIKTAHPDFEPSTDDKMLLTFLITGGYYTYFKYCDHGIKAVLELLEKLTENLERSDV